MDSRTDKKVNQFLETNNMDYLYLILANLEVDRLSNLPDPIKKNFKKKISDMALEHTAINEIPDYVLEMIENEADEDVRNTYNDYDEDDDFDDFNYQEKMDIKDIKSIDLDNQPVDDNNTSNDNDNYFDDEDDDFFDDDNFDDED